jgi:hypothetical protein
LKLSIIATRVAGQAEAVINGENGYRVEPNKVAILAERSNALWLNHLNGKPWE